MEERTSLHRYHLEHGGSRLPIGPGGILIGRYADCDVVVNDPHVSRQHALVRLTLDGPEIIPMGRKPVTINDAAVEQPRACRHGDEVVIGDRQFRIVATEGTGADEVADWVIERPPDRLYGVTHSPFRVGGADHDHLIIPGWDDRVLCFHLIDQALVVEAQTPGTVNDASVDRGETSYLHHGDQLIWHGETFHVMRVPRDVQRTTQVAPDTHPLRVRLQFLPNGGRLIIGFAASESRAYLSERACEFVSCLLLPPEPYRPGEIIPNEVLCAAIWPHHPERDRTNLNTIAFRLRQDLQRQGIDSRTLIERVAGGTRFRLAADTQVDVDA